MLFLDLQKQPNLSDCGLFVIANAMAICNSQSPEILKNDTKVMKNTLLEIWKIKSYVIFQLVREVLNRKQQKKN